MYNLLYDAWWFALDLKDGENLDPKTENPPAAVKGLIDYMTETDYILLRSVSIKQGY